LSQFDFVLSLCSFVPRGAPYFEIDQTRMAESVNGAFGQPPGNVFGLTPDYAVWVNRHVMIAVTTMMWMAEALGYDTAPMEGFFEDKVKSTLDIPDGVRVVALLGIGRLKGPTSRMRAATRRAMFASPRNGDKV
jgi:nitroreductase